MKNNKKSKGIGAKLASLGIRVGIGLAISLGLALVGVILVCGTFVFKPWMIASLIIFVISLLSIILSDLLTLLPAALNKVLMTVYSFAIVGAIFSLLTYAIISSKFNFEDMNWQKIFTSFAGDKLFYTIFALFAIALVGGYYGFVNRAELGDLMSLSA